MSLHGDLPGSCNPVEEIMAQIMRIPEGDEHEDESSSFLDSSPCLVCNLLSTSLWLFRHSRNCCKELVLEPHDEDIYSDTLATAMSL